ncbi:MAG: hypothetical protein Q7W13_17265 [Bacteroidia bacterium]|nr:hypothetical protein [Bacteroidia bacterium]
MLQRHFFFCSIAVFFSFIPGIAAQNDSLKNYSTENWKINFQIAPNNYAYRIAKRIDDNYTYPPKYFELYVNEKHNIYSWHFSISGTKKIARRIDLNFGVIIDNQGYKTKEFQWAEVDKYGNIISPIKKFVYIYDYRYFGLSLSGTEKLKLNDKTYLFLKNGINYYFQSRLIHMQSGDINKRTRGDLRPTNDLSVFVFAGINYKIGKTFSLSISPFFNYFLTPLTDPIARDGSSYQQNFFSTGIELGVHYNIGKK